MSSWRRDMSVYMAHMRDLLGLASQDYWGITGSF